jgi:hypothetical protein
MKKDLNSKRRSSGSKKNEPKVIGDVLNEYFASNESLAVAFRNRLFKDIHPHTELGVDLKMMTREPGRMPVGAYLDGAITHNGEDHYTFIQNDPQKKVVQMQRNPHVYMGKCINVNKKDDGTPYPTFNRPSFNEDFTFHDFCREAAEELLIVAGLVEKKRKAEK